MSRLRLNSIPASNRALIWTAIGVTACVSLLLLAGSYGGGWTLGDPDDALRLSMVRDLVHGRGWFDQRVDRLQPPLGPTCTGRACSTAAWRRRPSGRPGAEAGAAELAAGAVAARLDLSRRPRRAAAARRLAGEAAAGSPC